MMLAARATPAERLTARECMCTEPACATGARSAIAAPIQSMNFENFYFFKMRKIFNLGGRSEDGLDMRKTSAQCGRVGQSVITLSW